MVHECAPEDSQHISLVAMLHIYVLHFSLVPKETQRRLVMPTLTPKSNKLPSVYNALDRLRNLLALQRANDQTRLTDADVCFTCFDALQGILAVMLVYRNFQAAFFPCQLFGSSVAMVKDVTVCENEDTNLSSWGLPLPSQAFLIYGFLMISGIRQSQKLWKAPVDLFRVTVVQRMIQLILCGGAAILVATAMSFASLHPQVAELTHSMWLHGWNTEIHGYADLLSQIVLGPLHQTIAVNPSLWILYFEMVGSAVIAGLVLLLKASPHRLRSRWLMVVFVSMVVPSLTRTSRFDVNIGYNVLTGSEDRVTITRSVGIDPIHHSNLLQHISELTNSVSDKTTSAMTLSFEERDPEPWFRKEGRALDSTDQITKNTMLLSELLKASDKDSHSVSTPWVESATQSKWTRDAPWLLLSSFVGAAWISEAILSSSFSRVGRVPINPGHRSLLVIPCIVLLSASYPETPEMVATGFVWKVMEASAGLLGFNGTNASEFWGVVGSLFLSISICLFVADLRKLIVSHGHWLSWSNFGFSLVVTHAPILGSLSCGIFLFFHRFFEDDAAWPGFLALLLSVPVFLGLACAFHKFVALPSVSISEYMSRRFLGLSPYPDQGYSADDRKDFSSTRKSSESANTQVVDPL